MRGTGELTAEASKLLALKAELKAELSDDHGWASLFPAGQGSLLQRSTETAAFQEAPQWVPESPLAEGHSKQGQTCSGPHSGGFQCPLSIPLLRFSLERGCVSAGTSLCQPAREAHCPSAATLTVSSSPAHASQAGQGENPHGPGTAKCPRRGQHHPLYPCTCAVGCSAPAEKGQETTDSGILTQAHVWGSILARSRTLWDCKMNAAPVVSSLCVWGLTATVLFTEEM